MASDDLFSVNLILRTVRDQAESEGATVASLPEPQPMSGEQEKLLDEVACVIRHVGDTIDKETKFKQMVDGFSHVAKANKQSFQMLVDKVFHDGITWGRIVTLICVVAKSVPKIFADFVSGFVSWTLDYFRNKLLSWICTSGGWINSISSLISFSFERDFGSSSSPISLSSGLLFISGVLLGGFIVWRLNRHG